MAKKSPRTKIEPDDVPAGETEGATTAPRFSVQLTPEGRVAWDRIRAGTRDQLKALLSDPELSSRLGGVAVPGATGPAAEGFPPEVCGIIFDSLSMLMVGMARRAGYSADRAAGLAFSDSEKGKLTAPTVAVMNKYNVSLGKYEEEIMLGMTLVTILSGKLALLRAVPVEPPAPTATDAA
jgi:hypothetical protein